MPGFDGGDPEQETDLRIRNSLVFVCAAASAALSLAGCQKPADPAGEAYAGLPEAILGWRNDIERSSGCSVKPASGGMACQTFEVGCKAAQAMGPKDSAATAKVLVAMSWDAWSAKRGDYEPASGGAVFVKREGHWSRQDVTGPVNLSTCAAS